MIEACRHEDDIKCGPFGTQLKQSEYTKSGIPIWGIPQVNAAFTIPADTFVTPKKANDLSSFGIQNGDIAMSRKGNIGQCALYPENFQPGIISSDVLRIRPDGSRLSPLFLMCLLHNSSDVVHQIEMVGNGQIMKGINVTKLKNIVIYIPPLDLQKQFEAFTQQSDKSKLMAFYPCSRFRSKLGTHRPAYSRYFEQVSLNGTPQIVCPVFYFQRLVKPVFLQQGNQFIFHDTGQRPIRNGFGG